MRTMLTRFVDHHKSRPITASCDLSAAKPWACSKLPQFAFTRRHCRNLLILRGRGTTLHRFSGQNRPEHRPFHGPCGFLLAAAADTKALRFSR
jgi:hypothetical protein